MGLFDWLPVPDMDWKTIASIAVGTGVFVGLTVLTGGLGAPLLATLAVAGFGSGVAGQLVYDLLAGHKPGVDVLAAGVVSMGLTFVGAGVGRVVGPIVGPIVGKVLDRTPIPALVARAAGQADGALASNVGELVTAVQKANPRFGQPQLLDPFVFDPPAPPSAVAYVRPALGETGGFLGRLARIE